MIVLKWICFLVVCIDVIKYIVEQTIRIIIECKISGKAGGFIWVCLGIAVRVSVLYGIAVYWLFN